MAQLQDDPQRLIWLFEESAKTHMRYARLAHTMSQRAFHERQAQAALLRADKHRQALRVLNPP